MDFKELIEELKRREIEVTFSGGKLKYNGPEENITPSIIEELKQNKGRLIKYFWPEKLKILMPINPSGTKTPLFIVHGDNGNYIISDYLGQDQPVYGFFHPGSEGEGIRYKSVKRMASVYLEKILEVWPDGPYFLMGYSFGGMLAFEMAVQLQKLGREVPVLVIVDTISPLARGSFKWQNNLFQTIRINFLRPVRLLLKRKIRLLICNLYLLMNKPIPLERRNYYLMTRYSDLGFRYKPSKFEGNILLFRLTKNPSSKKYLGWETLVNDIKLVEIEGKHLDVFIGKERTELFKTEIGKYLNIVNATN